MTEQQTKLQAQEAADEVAGAAAQPLADAQPAENPLLRHADLLFAAGEIDQKVDALLAQQQGKITLPGFRRGKVPLSLLRQRYGRATLHEVLQNECGMKFQQVLEERDERAAAQPHLHLPDLAADGTYKVHCHYEIIPTVEAPDFSKQVLQRPTFEVNDAAVAEMIEILRRQRGVYAAADTAADDSHRLLVDFESVLLPPPDDAEAQEEVMESGEDRPLLLEDKSLRPELREALNGVAAGESRTVELAMGEDMPNEKLRGRKIRMAVTVKRVEQLVKAELDEKFFSAFSDDNTLEGFQSTVREHLQRESAVRLRNFLQTRAMNALIAATPPFALPQSMVIAECHRLLAQAQAQWKQRGMAETAARLAPAMFLPDAQRRVMLGLILSAWQQREKPEIGKEEISERLQEIAAAFEDPEAMAAKMRASREEMEGVYLSVLEDRIADWVCANCATEDAPMSITDFFNESGGV